MVRVRDRDGERVGGVRPGDDRAGKQHAQHRLYLFLGRGSGADDRHLDQSRRIFADRQAAARAGEQHHAARVGEFQRRLRVVVGEHFLDRGTVGTVVGDHRRQRGIEVREPVGQRRLRIGAHLAVRDVADPAPLDPDDAPSGAGQRGIEAEDDQPEELAEQDATEAASEPEAPQPAISLTVVYDPENANAGITTMASTPIEAKSSVENESATQVEVKTAAADAPVTVKPADSTIKPKTTPEPAPVIESVPAAACDQIPAPAPASVPAAAPTPAPAAPAIPEDFPVDFATEVFCPGPLLHQLSTYLPYGADTLGIVGEYYWIARERGTIEAGRNRASFPLRYTQAGKRHEVTVLIRRNTTGGLGATWAIDKVEAPVE